MEEDGIMMLDVATLLVCDVVVTFVAASAMYMYSREHKTYSGFSAMTMGWFIICLGYLITALRPALPEFTGILLTNLFLSFGLILRCDGMMQFLGRPRMRRLNYAVPVMLLAGVTYFYVVTDLIAVRTLLITIVATYYLAVVTLVFLFKRQPSEQALSNYIALFNIFTLAMMWYRSLYWLIHPGEHLFGKTNVLSLYFLSITLAEVGWCVCFILLNSQRLREELTATQEELSKKVEELQQAIAEIRTLNGILPICSSCRRIRDEQGGWHRIEEYVRAHTEAEFSHGICPDCAKELYPRNYQSILDKKNNNLQG